MFCGLKHIKKLVSINFKMHSKFMWLMCTLGLCTTVFDVIGYFGCLMLFERTTINIETAVIKHICECLVRGREPPDAMSLRYADTSLQDLLGRLSLYLDQASAMQTVPPLWSKRASTIQNRFLCVMKNVNNFFWYSGMRGFSKMKSIYQLS